MHQLAMVQPEDDLIIFIRSRSCPSRSKACRRQRGCLDLQQDESCWRDLGLVIAWPRQRRKTTALVEHARRVTPDGELLLHTAYGSVGGALSGCASRLHFFAKRKANSSNALGGRWESAARDQTSRARIVSH